MGEELEAKKAVYVESEKRVSFVWVIPIVALLLGAWLVYKTLNEQGSIIKIKFDSAEGLVAGKSVIKYKEIDVGLVKDISLSADLKSIIVTAEIKKSMKEYLSENTRFWILNAQFDATGIKGISTLLSGSYIVMEPKKGKESLLDFEGLDYIPVIEGETKGKVFHLETENIGALPSGIPVNYKKLPVGKVLSSTLDDKGEKLDIKIFVESPYDKFINSHTRFWNISGFDAKLDANGVTIRTASLQALLIGGISFDTFEEFSKKEEVKENHIFKLHDSIESAKSKEYHSKIKFWAFFEESVRGLSIGAPVEFRGIEIGKVLAFSLEGDMESQRFFVPVLFEISTERFTVTDEKESVEKRRENLQKLLDKGLAAELKTGNLLTGQIFVNIDFFPLKKRETKLKERNGIDIIPTVPKPIDSILNNAASLMDRLSSIPIESIGDEVHKSVVETKKVIAAFDVDKINSAIVSLENISNSLNSRTLPKLNSVLDSTNSAVLNANNSYLKPSSKVNKELTLLIEDLRKTANSTNKVLSNADSNYLNSDAKFKKELLELIGELTKTAKSIKSLTDYLERHPESLIKGK